jgi:hypothetical protein
MARWAVVDALRCTPRLGRAIRVGAVEVGRKRGAREIPQFDPLAQAKMGLTQGGHLGRGSVHADEALFVALGLAVVLVWPDVLT